MKGDFQVANYIPEYWTEGVFTRPATFECVLAFGQTFPREFRAKFAFVDPDDSGEEGVGTWTITFYIRVSDFGTPEVIEVTILGASESQKQEMKPFLFGSDDSLLVPPGGPYPADDAGVILRKQFRYVAAEWDRLIRIAMINVAEKWKADLTHSNVVWSRGMGPKLDFKFPESEIMPLRKQIETKLTTARGEAFLAKISKEYSELRRLHDNPTQVLADRYGKGLTTAQGWLKQARDLDMLPKGKRGRISRIEVPMPISTRPVRPKAKIIPADEPEDHLAPWQNLPHPGVVSAPPYIEEIMTALQDSKASAGESLHQKEKKNLAKKSAENQKPEKKNSKKTNRNQLEEEHD